MASVFVATLSIYAATAQESPSTTSPMPEVSPSTSPAPAASPTASFGQAPAVARSVHISFLPPPLEGTIILGIYDERGGLVRVLHQEAELDEFIVGEDALVTKWDGKNNTGDDLPAGKYRGRGYLVGHLKVESIAKAASPALDLDAAATVQVKLMPNPLAKDERPTISLSVGSDYENTFLRTVDGLPLFTISKDSKLVRAAITKNSDRSIDVWQDNGTAVEQLRVSNIDKMMAFDCGDFELK
jgi:hypothetical protein